MALAPIAVLFLPVVVQANAKAPTAVLHLCPSQLDARAKYPTAVFLIPVPVVQRAFTPTRVLVPILPAPLPTQTPLNIP